MKDIECPYCGHEQDVCHDDGAGYAEDEIHQMECESCEKSFVFTTMTSFDYFPKKADCLNGADHEYRRTNTVPRYAAELECKHCGDRKPIPDREELYKQHLREVEPQGEA